MSTRRIVLYCGAGVIVFLATLAVTAPAPWVARAVERASAQKLQLRAPAGNLWTGSGRLFAMPQCNLVG